MHLDRLGFVAITKKSQLCCVASNNKGLYLIQAICPVQVGAELLLILITLEPRQMEQLPSQMDLVVQEGKENSGKHALALKLHPQSFHIFISQGKSYSTIYF